jgi:hypothetical protein
MPNYIRRLVRVLASVSILSLALVYSAGTTHSGLDSVSCASTRFCVAIDGYYEVLTYNGTSWSSPSKIDPDGDVLSVSCPSATFCVAVDDDGYAVTYNGSTWSAPSQIDGEFNLASVSCASATFCAAVDAEGHVLTFNGASWSPNQLIDGTNPLTWRDQRQLLQRSR